LRRFALALAGGLAGAALAQEPAALLALERAEMVASDSRQIPPADAPWQPVALPHAWFRAPPPGRVVWYRIAFDLPKKPRTWQMLYSPRAAVHTIDLYLNGQPFALHTDMAATGTYVTPLMLRVPVERLAEGANVLHARVSGAPQWLHGMPRFHLGTAGLVRQHADAWRLLQSDIIMIFAFGFGMIGLFALALWPAERDGTLLWYGATGVAFGLVTLLWYATRQTDMANLRGALVYLRFFGFIAPIAILQLRISGRRWLWAEALLWLALAAGTAALATDGPWRATAWNVSMVAFPALLLACSLALLRPAAPVAAGTRALFFVAGLASAAFGVHDALVRTGYLPHDAAWLSYYLIPIYMLVAGAAIFERFVANVRALQRSRAELEARVEQKTREVEATQARLASQERERALAGERRRIMADMHDVLGSRLVGLLTLVQSGRTDRERLEQELAASLDELRMSIDSVQPVDGDLGVVLGNVRHRMRSVFGATGIALDWRVSELPRMDALTPARVLSIQRLLLEVFSNVLKHSGAKRVRVSTALADGGARIAIEDDGRGFDPPEWNGGRGLANLRARAGEAGGALDIASAPGEGTRVTLTLPLARAA